LCSGGLGIVGRILGFCWFDGLYCRCAVCSGGAIE